MHTYFLIHLNGVKWSSTELTIKSNCSQLLLLSVVLVYLRMHQIIPCALGCRAYGSVWREEGALCVECLAVFTSLPPSPHPLFSTVYQCDGCLSSWGREGSWLGCQVFPAISAVSILELATNSRSSRMSQAPDLHIAMQLLITTYIQSWTVGS